VINRFYYVPRFQKVEAEKIEDKSLIRDVISKWLLFLSIIHKEFATHGISLYSHVSNFDYLQNKPSYTRFKFWPFM